MSTVPERRASAGPLAPAARFLRSTVLLGAAFVLGACSARDTDLDSKLRGDYAFALGDHEEALAEYRLALAQTEGRDPELKLRLAHAYALSGRVEDAARHFEQLIETNPEYGNQAAADLMRIATEAGASGDRFAMARAVEAAQRMRPGIGLGPEPITLARHYFRNGEYGRALAPYELAMAEAADSSPEVVFEVGRAYEEVGDCRHALAYFERFREMVRPRERGEVDWFIGTCSFRRAGELSSADGGEVDWEEAIRLLDRVIELGEPRNLQAQAWFQKGNLLSDAGLCPDAMNAYSQVRFVDPIGPLVEQAQANFDHIRFGGGDPGISRLRGGRCR